MPPFELEIAVVVVEEVCGLDPVVEDDCVLEELIVDDDCETEELIVEVGPALEQLLAEEEDVEIELGDSVVEKPGGLVTPVEPGFSVEVELSVTA